MRLSLGPRHPGAGGREEDPVLEAPRPSAVEQPSRGGDRVLGTLDGRQIGNCGHRRLHTQRHAGEHVEQLREGQLPVAGGKPIHHRLLVQTAATPLGHGQGTVAELDVGVPLGMRGGQRRHVGRRTAGAT